MKRDRAFDPAFAAMPRSLRRVAERLPAGDSTSVTRVEYTTVVPLMGKPVAVWVGTVCVPNTYEPPMVGLPTILCDEKVTVSQVESIHEWDDETGCTYVFHTVQLEAAK